MRGMILAAGFGTRLRPLTDRVPKPLLRVADHPMIAYPIAVLRAAGITEIIINLHHLGEQIRQILGDGSSLGVSLTYSEEHPILDTGGAIKKAEGFLGGDRFVVINADTVIDLPLREVIEWHARQGALATMVLRPDPQAAQYGLIEIDTGGRIRRFLGRPERVDVPLKALMFAGVHVFQPEVFAHMGAGRFGITTTTYPGMLAAGVPLYGYEFNGYWRVLDTPDGLEEGRCELGASRVLRAENRP